MGVGRGRSQLTVFFYFSDVEVVYSDRQTSAELTVVTEPQKQVTNDDDEVAEDDAELDIDAI